MRIRIITRWSDFVELETAWNRLLKASGADTIFLTHQWFASLIAAFGLDKRLMIVLCYDADTLIGILPLYHKSVRYNLLRWRVLGSITNHHSQKFCFIFKKGAEYLMPVALLKLKAKPGWDMIISDFVSRRSFLYQSGSMMARFGMTLQKSPAMESQFIILNQDFESYYRKSFSKSLRKKVDRLIRKAERKHQLSVKTVNGATLTTDDLITAYTIENSGWKGRNKTAIIQNRSDFQFYTRLAWAASRQGWLALRFLRFDEKRVAFEYNLRYNHCESSLKASYDEAFSKYSVGHILTKFSIMEAYQRNDKIYDLLGPADIYKSKIANDADQTFKIYIFNRNPKSNLLRLILIESKKVLARTGLKKYVKNLLRLVGRSLDRHGRP